MLAADDAAAIIRLYLTGKIPSALAPRLALVKKREENKGLPRSGAAVVLDAMR
jgi:hypothetical protein